MKRLIFQVKVGPNPPAFYDTCINSVKQYCKHHHIDHRVLEEPKLKIRPLNSHRSKEAVERLGYLPIFEKEVAFEYLDQYDQIAIIDSDIYVRNIAANIFDELSGDTVFAGVRECDMPLTKAYIEKIKKFSVGQYQKVADGSWSFSPQYGYAFFNMGVMLFSSKLADYLNRETPKEFIHRPEFAKFVNGVGNWKWSTDQTLLNYWVQTSGMKTKNLDWRWNALVKAVKDDVLPHAHFLHFFLSANMPRKGKEIPQIIKNLSLVKNLKERK